jgi:hypothetical protein
LKDKKLWKELMRLLSVEGQPAKTVLAQTCVGVFSIRSVSDTNFVIGPLALHNGTSACTSLTCHLPAPTIGYLHRPRYKLACFRPNSRPESPHLKRISCLALNTIYYIAVSIVEFPFRQPRDDVENSKDQGLLTLKIS